MFFHMVYKSGQIFLPFCHKARVWQTRQNSPRYTASALHAARSKPRQDYSNAVGMAMTAAFISYTRWQVATLCC